jgi:hypothetical protein
MERELNTKFLNGNYVISGVGVNLLHHFIGDNPLDNTRSQRVGRFILMFNNMRVATSGNFLVLKTEMFEPCSLKKLQELSGLKERAFRTFKKDLQEKDYIKIEDGIIYVNPLFAMATDMDYIREDLINKFPKYKEAFNKINNDLLN